MTLPERVSHPASIGAGDDTVRIRNANLSAMRCDYSVCKVRAFQCPRVMVTLTIMLRFKSVADPIDHAADGMRILATRFRGHGMTSDRYDVWMANLGPSETLLRAFLGGKITWNEFGKRYKLELFEGGGVDARNRTIRNHGQKFTLRLLQELSRRSTITLMCHCATDEPHCHLRVLTKVLKGTI